MNENSAIQPGLSRSGSTDTGPSQDGLARCGERELGRLRALHDARNGAAIRIPSQGGADPGLGGGLSPDERALLLAAFGIDAHTRPLSLLAVDFIRTRRRLRDAGPRTAAATC